MTEQRATEVVAQIQDLGGRNRETALFRVAKLIEQVRTAEYEAADLRRHAALLAIGFDPFEDYAR